MTDPSPPRPAPRRVKSPTGAALHCRNWQIEAAWRMLQNNLCLLYTSDAADD